jgi:hypothetical protein
MSTASLAVPLIETELMPICIVQIDGSSKTYVVQKSFPFEVLQLAVNLGNRRFRIHKNASTITNVPHTITV